MRMRRALWMCASVVAIVVAGAGSVVTLSAQQGAGGAVHIDGNAIGGVVTGPSGPEAGVWVIAETTELPTKFARMVVTDDQGRYVVPDLPKAKYKVWVRGYGLVDSPKVDGEPGKPLNLRAVPAPNDAAAAQYYPAIYWYSMMQIPHAGQSGEQMTNQLAGNFGGAPFKYLGEWTDRIAKGELPKSKPTRPQGVERNVVVTSWEWSTPDKYLHDLISTDRRNPTVNAYGPLFGSPEYSTDMLPILDPKTHTATTFPAPVRDADTPEGLGPGHAAMATPLEPSAYWGKEKIWDTKVNNHNSMIDRKGRVWLAAAVRGPENPDFCKKGSDHPSAKLFPLKETHRALAMLDPKTMKYTFIDTCFQTHHLNFAYDANETLWTSSGGGGEVVGWLNTKMFDETGDAAKSQGWTALILDTNGNGKRDDYVEPNAPVDPTKDKRIAQ